MGGTIIPGIAALWEKKSGRKEVEGRRVEGGGGERAGGGEREVSHVIAGFHLSSQQSHNRNVLQHLANKDDSASLSLHSKGPQNQNIFLCRATILARTDAIIQLLTGFLNSFTQELPLLIVSSRIVRAQCAPWSVIQTRVREGDTERERGRETQ